MSRARRWSITTLPARASLRGMSNGGVATGEALTNAELHARVPSIFAVGEEQEFVAAGDTE